MKIAGINYEIDTQSIDIFISGCYGNCKGCHNEDIKDFNIGNPNLKEAFDKVESIVNSLKGMPKGSLTVKHIRLMGGEPLDNNLEILKSFVDTLSTFNIPMVLFTRRELDHLKARSKYNYFLETFDYIKCGPYDCSVTTYKEQYGMTILENQNYYKKGLEY